MIINTHAVGQGFTPAVNLPEAAFPGGSKPPPYGHYFSQIP